VPEPGSLGPASYAEWLSARMDALGFGANSELARASGVPDSAISRWRTTGTTPTIAQLRRLVGPLQASLLELLVAAGHLTRDEARLREVVTPVRQPRTTAEAIDLDPELPDDLKHLLHVQYEAMLALASARRGTGLAVRG
jgi:transcriptional regulator with XRE-family HTH domain